MATEMARVDLKNEGEVREWFVCDETRLGPAVAGAKINTDDNMHIEMTVPREAFRPLMQTNAEWVQALGLNRVFLAKAQRRKVRPPAPRTIFLGVFAPLRGKFFIPPS